MTARNFVLGTTKKLNDLRNHTEESKIYLTIERKSVRKENR